MLPEFMSELKKSLARHIEMMAAAYISQTDIPIEDCELVVEQSPNETQTVYRFRRRVVEPWDIEHENTLLRGIASQVMPCHYCGAGDVAKCPHGFPGCSLMDDIAGLEDEIRNRIAYLQNIERVALEVDAMRGRSVKLSEFLGKLDALTDALAKGRKHHDSIN